MKITEVRGNSHTFTLTDKTTLRVFSRQSVPVKDELVSEEILRAEKMGLIVLTPEVKVTAKTSTKETGGDK